jgi:hypothetical protein
MLHDSATIQSNHERFVSRVAESEVVWGFQAPSGFAVCPSNDEQRNGWTRWGRPARSSTWVGYAPRSSSRASNTVIRHPDNEAIQRTRCARR